ncbi:DedA family protein [Clostridium cylindrosporum]|uniref:DedA family protein n=1 Tax=Clostridium cylindrosporum DSM 605 TaxID=1121307 RepID=A0A0J8DCS9_CLOCY|nr:DedA family protein [Clostridium cylindrosporum]KMT22059.1 DedA family protein [Clostridium cylindrosporum DSM 605]
MESSLFSGVFEYLVNLISSVGYLGVFAATSLEYACFPLPSEIILPFIGYLASIKSIGLIGGIIVSSIAGIVGSLVCYFIGYFGGKPVLDFIGDKFKSSKKPIRSARNWFDRYDKMSVLLARLLPLARTYISIPAGISKMNLFIFIFYSSIGIIIWNTALISLGYYLRSNWKMVEYFIEEYTIAAGIIVLLGAFSVIYLKIKRKKTSKSKMTKKL